MITARSLTKWFGGILAVDSVDFEIPKGKVVGFLGPNGAGKTTTIRMIAGFLPPSRGSVEVDGLDVVRHSRQVRQRIGYLPESAPLYTEMRVSEFLRFRAKLFGVERSRRKLAIETVLRRCGLEEVRRRPIGQLSKGYRQRVGLAAAMVHQPPVLILDEPTVGLDPAQIREVRSMIRELAEHHTILLSTHILPEVELTCDRIMMIARGRIRAQGTMRELIAASPSGRYTIETESPRAAAALREVRGVAEVEAVGVEGNWRRLAVTAAPGARDLREPLAAALAKVGGVTRQLNREATSLEHLFVQMIAQAEVDVGPSEQARSGKPREAAA